MICDNYSDAQREEIRLIAELRPEYNITKGGGGALGLKHSPESLEKMRLAKVGVPGNWLGKKRPDIVEGARQRLLKNPMRYWLGKKRSQDTIDKIMATKAAKPYKPPTEKAMAARLINFRKCQLSKLKKVRCINDGAVYDSLTDAAMAYGTSKQAVWRIANGCIVATRSGFKFEYETACGDQ